MMVGLPLSKSYFILIVFNIISIMIYINKIDNIAPVSSSPPNTNFWSIDTKVTDEGTFNKKKKL